MELLAFGTFLKNERINKNMTQKDLAKKLHVSVAAVSKWERGKSLPDIEKFDDIAEIFDVSLLEVFNCKRDPNRISSNEELSRVYENTKMISSNQYKKRYIRILVLLFIIAAIGVSIHYFPLYRAFKVWPLQYYNTGEITDLIYIGSLEDRQIAQNTINLADRAFSNIGSSKSAAYDKYGMLSKYTLDTNGWSGNAKAVREKHKLKLLSAHFQLTTGSIWVNYTREGYDRAGNTITGSYNVDAYWVMEKDSNGNWVVVGIDEAP